MFGLMNSVVYSNALTALWLKQAGVGVGSSLKELFVAQIKTFSGLGETVTKSELRDVSFNDGRKILEKIKSALSDESDPTGELRKTLHAIPKAKLQFSAREYWKKKLDLITGLQSRVDSIPDLSLSDAEEFAGSDLWSYLTSPYVDQKAADKWVKAAKEKTQGTQATKLAGLMEFLMSGGGSVAGDTLDTGSASGTEIEMTEEDTKAIKAAQGQLRAITELRDAFIRQPESDKAVGIEAAMKFLGKDKGNLKDPEAFFDALSAVDDSTCQRALQILTSVSGGEHDAIKGDEHDAVAGDTVEDAQAHHAAHKGKDKNRLKRLVEDNRLVGALNHNAKEVLWALLTQIPSVPALVRIAKKMLPVLVGVKPGERPTPGQLKLIVAATLGLTGVMSGVADNVAAYMFCRTVLFDFYKDTFGESFESNEKLKGEIDIIACKGAEQGGSLTKVGNGPNFSQKRLVLVKDDSNQQGVSIDIQDMTMGETLENGFSLAANGSYVLLATAYLCSGITQLEAENDNRKTASVDNEVMDRRTAFRRAFGGTAA